MINIFRSDENYDIEILKYTKIDGILALLLYAILMVSYYIIGRLLITTGGYYGILVSVLCAVITLVLVFIRKQSITSVGITKYRLKKSVTTGFIIGGIYISVLSVIPNMISGASFIPVSKLLYNIVYYFVIIGFMEELVFRGYIQLRLHGLIKNRHVATFLGGILFSLMHIPFQMAVVRMSAFEYIYNNILTLLILIGWHYVFVILYKKYNNIWLGTIFHGFMNLSNYIFIK